MVYCLKTNLMSQPRAQIKVLSQGEGDVLEKAEKKFGDKRPFFIDFHLSLC